MTVADFAVPADEQPPELNREKWLTLAIDELRPIFRAAGYPLPKIIHVSVGWPSTGGLGQRIGQAWSPDTSEDKRAHVFISPVLGDSLRTLKVLTHELGHVAVGTKCGHRGAFVRWMNRMGMEGKPTEAEPGADLTAKCELIIERIGEYPHARIAPPPRKVQGTRMLKVVCPECGYTLRTTRKWLDEGIPTCPCGAAMMEEDALGDLEDPLVSVTATHEFAAHDGRFKIVYLKRLRKDRAVEVRWLVTDWEEEGGRVTPLPSREDVIGFMEAVIEGVYKYDTHELIDPPDEDVDWDDPDERDWLDPDEEEIPDDPESSSPDPLGDHYPEVTA